MKKKIKQIILSVFILSLFVCSSSAHEIYYDDLYGAIGVEWCIYDDDSLVYLQANGDYLNSLHYNYYYVCSNYWETYCDEVHVVFEDYSSSTVDFATPSKSWWQTRIGDGYADVFGTSDLYTTDNLVIQSGEDAEVSYDDIADSSQELDYAQVYISPYLGSDKVSQIKKTMTHETGHVLGLGHPDNNQYDPIGSSVTSIMRSGNYAGYVKPQNHDINDVDDKY